MMGHVTFFFNFSSIFIFISFEMSFVVEIDISPLSWMKIFKIKNRWMK
jgi:hypothetical protein